METKRDTLAPFRTERAIEKAGNKPVSTLSLDLLVFLPIKHEIKFFPLETPYLHVANA